jgi:hypothetical protein
MHKADGTACKWQGCVWCIVVWLCMLSVAAAPLVIAWSWHWGASCDLQVAVRPGAVKRPVQQPAALYYGHLYSIPIEVRAKPQQYIVWHHLVGCRF